MYSHSSRNKDPFPSQVTGIQLLITPIQLYSVTEPVPFPDTCLHHKKITLLNITVADVDQ